MKSTLASIVWIALVGLCAIGLSDALQAIQPSQTHVVGLIAYAALMVSFPAYSLIRRQRVHWPTLFIAVAVAAGFSGSLLLARPDSISEGTAFLAMGASIFVTVLLRSSSRA